MQLRSASCDRLQKHLLSTSTERNQPDCAGLLQRDYMVGNKALLDSSTFPAILFRIYVCVKKQIKFRTITCESHGSQH